MPISSGQVWAVLNITDRLVATLLQSGAGYQSGSNSALNVYNLAFDSLAAIYGRLLTANTSNAQLHCGLVDGMQQRYTVLLSAAMSGHAVSDVDVVFNSTAYWASASRVSTASNSTVQQLSIAIPSAAFYQRQHNQPPPSFVDVQRIIFDQSHTLWSSCFSTRADTSLNTSSVAALIPGPLYVIQVVDETGAEVVVAGLNSSSPVRFTLPYTATNTSSTTRFHCCHCYHRYTSVRVLQPQLAQLVDGRLQHGAVQRDRHWQYQGQCGGAVLVQSSDRVHVARGSASERRGHWGQWRYAGSLASVETDGCAGHGVHLSHTARARVST